MYFTRGVLERFRHFFDSEWLSRGEPFPLHDLRDRFGDARLTGHHIAFDGRFRSGTCRASRARCENQYRQKEGETGGS